VTKNKVDLHPQSNIMQSMESSQTDGHKMCLTCVTSQNKVDSYPQLNITQSMESSLTDGYKMCLTCVASISSNKLTNYVADMKWSGVGLQQQSLWVHQYHTKIQDDRIERKLLFNPWLDSHAGEYTCHLVIKNNSILTVKKSIMVRGM